MKKILFFNEIDKKFIDKVGGKGSNLGELYSNGFQVPSGFCVTTDFSNEFMSNINIDYSLLTSNPAENSKLIRESIISHNFSNELIREIDKAMHSIKGDFFAIRSSATNEDNPDNSFAGQMDTYLNIKVEDIAYHIKKCIASLFTERACTYRNINNISHKDTKISIVVMEMVQSEVSGIMFTANPLTNNRDQVVIDSSYGLGEALVSGLVDPDTFTVNMSDGAIVNKKLGNKDFIIKGNDSGKKINNNLHLQSLTDKQIKELTNLGNKVEKHYKIPMDIEWALVEDKFYILQARPITTLFPNLEGVNKNDIFISLNHLQVMTIQFSPLGTDLLKYMFNFDTTVPYKKNPYIVNAGGYIYINITRILSDKKASKIFQGKSEYIGKDFKNTITQYLSGENYKGTTDIELRKAVLKKIMPLGIKSIKHILKPDRAIETKSTKKFLKQIENNKEILDKTPVSEKINTIKTVVSNSLYEKIKVTGPPLFSAFFAAGKLKKILSEKNTVKLFELTVGERGNSTTEMALFLNEISEFYRNTKIENIKSCNNVEDLIDLLESQKEKDRVKKFFEVYGCRGIGELDIANDRYFEDISIIKSSILNNIKIQKKGEYLNNFEKLKGETREFKDKIIYSVKDRDFITKLFVGKYIKIIQTNYILREHHKLGMVQLLTLIKNEIKKIGKLLVEKSLIEEVSDIFYLDLDEIQQALECEKNYRSIIIGRKLKYIRYEKLTIPKLILGSGEIMNYKRENFPGDLIGEGISEGITVGKVHVILDPKDVKIEKGEILVVPFTDPGWTPLFVNAGGLIMEVGGLMTHGAIVAREYKIPAVAGATDATKKLKTGDIVEIDGSSGIINKIIS